MDEQEKKQGTEEFDHLRLSAMEELGYATSTVVEALIDLLIEKGYITKDELYKKIDGLEEYEDIEEVSLDADKPREPDTND